MKKYLVAFIVFSIFLFSSCNQSGLDNTDTTEYGSLKIILPISKTLTNAEASTVADTYTVYAWSENGYVYKVSSRDSENGEIPQINLPVGNYKVLVCAGVYVGKNAVINITDAHESLCGSGDTQVTIIPSAITEATVYLQAPSCSIGELPTSVGVGDMVTFSAEIDFGNDMLMNYSDMLVIYKDGEYFGRISTNPAKIYSKASGSADYVVSETTGTFSFQYGPWGIRIYDEWIDGFYGITYALGPIGIEDYDSIFDAKQITVYPQSSNLQVAINWKND